MLFQLCNTEDLGTVDVVDCDDATTDGRFVVAILLEIAIATVLYTGGIAYVVTSYEFD